jgi:anti-anti-sigma factor
LVDSLEAELVHLDGSALLMMRGEIDMASASLFRSAIEETMSLDAPVVVDLENVTFMDSSGLHVLVLAAQRTDSASPLCVRNPSTQVRRLLRMSELDRLICPEQTPNSNNGSRGLTDLSDTEA